MSAMGHACLVASRRGVTEHVRSAVQELSGTQYVDTYGSSVKAVVPGHAN